VIIGGGVGGLACAQRLVKRAGGDLRVELIDRTLRHDFAPSFPWLIVGRRRAERTSRSLVGLARDGVVVTEAEVEHFDLDSGIVTTSTGEVAFDELVLAPGATLVPTAIAGLSEAAHGFYTREDATRLGEELAGFGGGRVLIVVAAMPFKCPAAPYEAAFLIEDMLRRRGVTAKVDIVTAEPQPMPVAGTRIGAGIAAMLGERGIGFSPARKLESVDPEAREARFDDGNEGYDLMVAVPPHRAPELVAGSPLAGPNGWIGVDPATLRAAENVHAIGDITAIKLANGMLLPKAGVFAHGEAEVVADNIAAAARGSAPATVFDGNGSCFLETGAGRAGYASGDFYAEPDPDVRMRRPARRWHWGKLLFERRWLARLPRSAGAGGGVR
jgi:sulfide:quinone oxidoreductase